MDRRGVISNPISKEEALERLFDNFIFEIEDHCYNDSSADYSIRVVVKETTDEKGRALPREYQRYGFFQGSDAIELLEAMIKIEREREREKNNG